MEEVEKAGLGREIIEVSETKRPSVKEMREEAQIWPGISRQRSD